jgi:maltose-binding protein MalE
VKLPSALLIGFILAAGAVSAQDPKKTAAQLTGDAKGSAANNPVCKLFTAAEASKYVGKTVGDGKNAAMGSGCQWATKDYEGDMMVQIVPASYHEQPKLAKGFQAMPELGTKGFAVPEMGGWKAAVIRGKESIIVTVAGPAASQKTAVALLKETLSRRK